MKVREKERVREIEEKGREGVRKRKKWRRGQKGREGERERERERKKWCRGQKGGEEERDRGRDTYSCHMLYSSKPSEPV